MNDRGDVPKPPVASNKPRQVNSHPGIFSPRGLFENISNRVRRRNDLRVGTVNSIDLPNDAESDRTSFEKTAQRGINKALALIEQRFEKNPIEENNMAFHNTKHTREVVQRVELIMRTLQKAKSFKGQISERDIWLAKLIAAYHDVVQDWVSKEGKNGTKIRERRRGYNEQASAEELVEFMEESNKEALIDNKLPVFLEEDKVIARQAIHATIPDFDLQNHTVVQPERSENPSLAEFALTLADINACGMDPFSFAQNGSQLFREENLDIVQVMKNRTILTAEQKKNYKERIGIWMRGQISFARGRKALIDGELKFGLRDHEDALILLKNNVITDASFDDSIALSEEESKILSSTEISFEEVFAKIGFID